MPIEFSIWPDKVKSTMPRYRPTGFSGDAGFVRRSAFFFALSFFAF